MSNNVSNDDKSSVSKLGALVEVIGSFKGTKVNEIKCIFKRWYKACSSQVRFIDVTEWSTLLLHIDVASKDLDQVKTQVLSEQKNALKVKENLETEIDALKKEIAHKDGIIRDNEITLGTNKEVIKNLSDSEVRLKQANIDLESRVEIKTKLLDEKSIELVAEKKKHTSCLTRLNDKNAEVKRLSDELVEINSKIETKITQGIRAKCTYDADQLLKHSKEPVPPVEVKPTVNSSGGKVAPELVIEARRMYAKGIKKHVIEKELGLNKSTTIRICNNESYRDAKYYPDGKLPEFVKPKPECEEVPVELPTVRGETAGVIMLDECAFTKDQHVSKAKNLLKKNTNRKKKNK